MLLDALYGAIYLRFLARHAPLSDEFINNLCKVIVDAVMILRPNPRS